MPKLRFVVKMWLYFLFLFSVISASNEWQEYKTVTSYQYIERYYDKHQKIEFQQISTSADRKWLCLAFGLCSIAFLPKTKSHDKFTTLYEWGNLEYDYPSDEARQQAIENGEFVLENGAPIDTDVYYTSHNYNKIFVSIPRFQNGIPATFGTVTNRVFNGNPIIAPFPSWSWHRNTEACNRDRLVSVFRFKIDECQRLWILDTGRIGENQVCSPQIIAFDLRTNNVVHRYEIPSDQITSTSILVTLAVDVRDPRNGCRDTFIYVADCQGFSIIVYDVQSRTSWRIVDKTMYPNPYFGTFHIAGYSFDLMDGILGMDLSPYKPGQDRILYYHALTSGSEQWVYTSHLRNHSLFLNGPSSTPEIFNMYSGTRNTQSPAMAIDKNGIAYFGLVSDLSMNCWNTATEYGSNNIGEIARDNVRLQFPSGVKVITNKMGKEELWFVTMRFQRMATGTLDISDKNFRIMAGKIDDLNKDSKCFGRPSSQSNQYGLYGLSHSQSHGHGGGYGFNKRPYKDDSLQFPKN